jgi:hypothetical protein
MSAFTESDAFLVGAESIREIGRMRLAVNATAAGRKPAAVVARPTRAYRGWSPYWSKETAAGATRACIQPTPKAARAMLMHFAQARYREVAGHDPPGMVVRSWQLDRIDAAEDPAQLVIDIARDARLAGCLAAAIPLVRWRASWDCPALCRAMDGILIPSGKIRNGVNAGYGAGWIGNCRCEVEPVTSYLPERDTIGFLRGYAKDDTLVPREIGTCKTLLPADWQPYLTVLEAANAAGWVLPGSILMLNDLTDDDEFVRQHDGKSLAGLAMVYRTPDRLLVSRYAAEDIAPDVVLLMGLLGKDAPPYIEPKLFQDAPHLVIITDGGARPSLLLTELGEEGYRQEAILCGVSPKSVNLILSVGTKPRTERMREAFARSWLTSPELPPYEPA